MNYLNQVLIEGSMRIPYVYSKGDGENRKSEMYFVLSWYDFHKSKKIDVPCVAYGKIADDIDEFGSRGMRIIGVLDNDITDSSLRVKVDYVEFKPILKNMG